MSYARPRTSLPLIAGLLSFVVLALAALPSRASEVRPAQWEVKRLASTPEVRIEEGVCHVRGAFWRESYGAVSDKSIELQDAQGRRVALVKTDRNGVYDVAIPLPEGRGLILKEIPIFETGIRAGLERSIAVKRHGGWQTQGRYTSPKIVCAKPSVDVGEVQQLVSSVMEARK